MRAFHPCTSKIWMSKKKKKNPWQQQWKCLLFPLLPTPSCYQAGKKKREKKNLIRLSSCFRVRPGTSCGSRRCSAPAPPPRSRKRLKTRKLRLSCIDWEPKWRGVRDGGREGGGRVNIWGGGGGGGVNFDRRMEASVGKSPEGEQLLMPSNRSPIQGLVSVVASCFLFLLPVLLSRSLLSFPPLSPFHPPPDFFLPTTPLVLPSTYFVPLPLSLYFSLCNHLLIFYLCSFLCVQLPPLLPFFSRLIFIITSLLVCFSPPPLSLFYCFLPALLISSAVFSSPPLSFSFLLFPAQSRTFWIPSYLITNSFFPPQFHFFSILIDSDSFFF